MSREQIVASLMTEDERLQYDGRDPERIYNASEKVTQSFISLLNKAAAFRDEVSKEVTEDLASDMKEIRYNLVVAYAEALVDLHQLGATFRISGDAFDKMVEYVKGDGEAPLELAGL